MRRYLVTLGAAGLLACVFTARHDSEKKDRSGMGIDSDPPGLQLPRCSATLDCTPSIWTTGSHYECTLANNSEPAIARFTMLRVLFPSGHSAEQVVSPKGWSAWIQLCDDGVTACGVEWRTRVGVAPGERLPGFAIRFAQDVPTGCSFFVTEAKDCQLYSYRPQ